MSFSYLWMTSFNCVNVLVLIDHALKWHKWTYSRKAKTDTEHLLLSVFFNFIEMNRNYCSPFLRRSQATLLGEAKYVDFKPATVFALRHHHSKHKTKRYGRNLVGGGPFGPLATPVYPSLSWQIWCVSIDQKMTFICKYLFFQSVEIQSSHGRNVVRDTKDVSPPLFQTGGIICHVPPHFFLFRVCIWWGFKNKSDVCHVLCDELFMLDDRPHIAMLMLKQKFGVVSLILLVYKFLASIKQFLACFKWTFQRPWKMLNCFCPTFYLVWYTVRKVISL